VDGIGTILALIALFYLLGKAADAVVVNVRNIGERLGVNIFFLGLILGFLTSLPELSVGINAISEGVPRISLGNLFGGILVLFGLILGVSVVINRKIKTDGDIQGVFQLLLFIVFPFLLGLDGSISWIEGIGIIVAYFLLLAHLYRKNNHLEKTERITVHKRDLLKNVFFVIAGIVFVIVISNIIIRMTLSLLESFGIPPFITGLLFFSIGTNLPEIIVTIRSWKRHIKELSVSNLLGSGIANAMIVGILAVMKTLPVELDLSYLMTIGVTLFLMWFFLKFYKTGNAFVRREGVALIGIYGFFVLTQILFTFLD